MMTREECLTLYRELRLARQCEEKIRELYPSNEIKTPVHLGIGGEAIPVGVCHCAPPESKFFGSYRNHTLFLTLSNDTDGFFAELYGKVTGVGKGKAGSMHLAAPQHGLIATSAVVATTIPVAVGAALSAKYQKKPSLAVVFFGDGAVEEGVFWESLNFACLHELKVLFVCEDNELAIHSPIEGRRGLRSVVDAVKAYNCHVRSGRGDRLVSVIEESHKMIQDIVATSKPGFLHLKYHRFLEHVGPNEDFDAGYREKPSPEEEKELDPLITFKGDAKKCGCSDADFKKIDDEVDKQIEKSIEKAKAAAFPGPEELYTDVLI
jgi:TPP-dependent pyruvate/acetoin dehydrogenase alpha subunit